MQLLNIVECLFIKHQINGVCWKTTGNYVSAFVKNTIKVIVEQVDVTLEPITNEGQVNNNIALVEIGMVW